jgi:hypothetical protein
MPRQGGFFFIIPRICRKILADSFKFRKNRGKGLADFLKRCKARGKILAYSFKVCKDMGKILADFKRCPFPLDDIEGDEYCICKDEMKKLV